jgi:hypothetical protein
MPEDTPHNASSPAPSPEASPDTQQPAAPADSNSQPPISFNIGEEYGTAKKNLPPIKIVLIAIGIVAIVAAVAILIQRPHSLATGSITDVSSVDVAGQNIVMVALNVSLQNRSARTYWIKTIKVSVDTPTGHFDDDAASAVDFDRYFQAFPALKEHALTPLIAETKIAPGASFSGTVVVSFPVTADDFANRKSMSITIQPYDAIPLVLTK